MNEHQLLRLEIFQNWNKIINSSLHSPHFLLDHSSKGNNIFNV